MSSVQQDQLRERIAKEFDQFLQYTTIPAFFIIAAVVGILISYACYGISRRINNLTDMVENPHKFKEKLIKNKDYASNENEGDEIDRLEKIFAQFY
jgi:hypothetical protein